MTTTKKTIQDPDLAKVEAALLRAEALAPGNGDFQNALAIFYAQNGSREQALRHARRWVDLTGGAAPARSLLEQIEAMPATR